jgi:hypothetical protein
MDSGFFEELGSPPDLKPPPPLDSVVAADDEEVWMCFIV